MSARTGSRLAWLLWTLAMAFAGAGAVFRVLNHRVSVAGAQNPQILEIGFLLVFMVFATIGAIIASRQPGNVVGWIFCALGLFTLFAGAGEGYALYALVTRPNPLPGGEVMVWLAAWFGGAVNFALFALVFLLFPDGRLLSRRWRLVAWTDLIAIALLFAWSFGPGPIENTGVVTVENPFGIPGTGAALDALGAVGLLLTLAVALAGAVSLVLRLRRARGVERQRLKWFVFAGALFCAVFATGPLLWSLPESAGLGRIWPVLFLVGVGAIPVATGIAILKHNLYDIDLLINRTLVYGSLTAMLAALYLAGVVVLQYALRATTGQESGLAVVASTLAIAALFNPLRRRVQGFVDRRFYRRKYDAAKTLAALGARLRDKTQLDTLSGDVVGVVRETMQPAHVSLWLREPGRGAREKGPRDGRAAGGQGGNIAPATPDASPQTGGRRP